MAVYDFATVKIYHGKRIRIIDNAVSIRQEFLDIWCAKHIQKEYLENFASLKEPEYEFYMNKFYTGKMDNFNKIFNGVSAVMVGKFAKPEFQGLFDNFYLARLSPFKAEREMHINRLRMLEKFSYNDEFEIPEVGANNRKAITYIDRYLSMRKP